METKYYQTEHYIVSNMDEFSDQPKPLERLKEYLNDIENIFPFIEEIFDRKWNDSDAKIEIRLKKEGKSEYKYNPDNKLDFDNKNHPHIIKFKINNGNIKNTESGCPKKNLWGCLFHETHHAFLQEMDGRAINKNYKEMFICVSMATTYLKLKEEGRICQCRYDDFLSQLKTVISHNKNEGAMELFNEYFSLFDKVSIFTKFISDLRSSNSVFTDQNNFQQDLENFKSKIKTDNF
jgi:hypothetical protein